VSGRLDGSHWADEPERNRHIVRVDWFRIEMRALHRFGGRWELETVVPFDVKRVRARYELPDGSRFDNPQADLHHRSETLSGISDIQQWFGINVRDVLFESGEFGLAAGVSLPVGRTEPNPYKLADEGRKHQHIQFGTGTFDPLLRARYFVKPAWWGVSLAAGGQLPLYENRHGFRAPPIGDASAMLHAEVVDWFAVGAGPFVQAQAPGYWSGKRDPNTGYVLAGARLVPTLRPYSWLHVSASGSYAFYSVAVGGGEGYKLDWVFGLSVSLLLP
jgi:hypothetical protein